MKIENAKITSTRLGWEDHGIFTAYLTLEGNAWGCAFGGYCLDSIHKDSNGKFVARHGSAYGMQWIEAVLKTLEVEKWEDVDGQLIRAEIPELGGVVKRIGHLIKDKWFDAEAFKEVKP